ncbi:MAG: hypothetical protein RLZZ301_1543 [Bacteroidota bacterium]|jgi:hypothetical protein
MRGKILFIGLMSWQFATAQVQLFYPKKTPKEHARALIALPDFSFVSGSSAALIRSISPSGMLQMQSELDSSFREIRDICQTSTGFVALQSNDSSALIRLDAQLKVQQIERPTWQGKALFLDGISAVGDSLFAFGDPVNQEFATFISTDGGFTWQATSGKVKANIGEAAFAASGQSCQVYGTHIYFISGGLRSMFYASPDFGKTWQAVPIPYPSCPSCGPYAVAFSDRQHIVCVGGDYTQPKLQTNTCFYSTDGGLHWQPSKRPPTGYRSCVIAVNNELYACGTNGIDVSKNGGKTWKKISTVNALSMAYNGRSILVSLANGSYLFLHP